MNIKRTFIAMVAVAFCWGQTYSKDLSVAIDTLVNEIEIWPGVGPGSENLSIEENIVVRGLTADCSRDWAVEKVTVPTITPLIPNNPNSAAVILCPGGANKYVVYDVEGMDVGRFLNSIGVTAFVLKYRLPMDNHENNKDVPLQDAQRAMRYVRANAAQWGIDTNKIGIMGASAGGHMASTLATQYNKNVYDVRDSIDYKSAKPNFMLLLYPVVSFQDDITHTGTRGYLLGSSPSQELKDEFSAELNVTSQSPPTFFAHANDDSGVSTKNSERLYQALVDSGVTASSLNLYRNGGHGVGICKAVGKDFANWPYDFTNWMNTQGLTDSSFTFYEFTTDVVGEGRISPSLGRALKGSKVTVKAIPTSGWQFDGWAGDADGSETSITFTLDGDKNITANFSEKPNSINTLNSGDVLLYPNPTDNILYLNISNISMKGATINIYNQVGQSIYEKKVYKSGIEIITSDFSSGIYFLSVRNKQKISNLKFIKD